MTIARNRMGRAAAMTLAALLLIPITSCDRVRGNLLEAIDPDLILPATVSSPEAADALRVGTLGRVRGITGGGEAWLLPGMLTDIGAAPALGVMTIRVDSATFVSRRFLRPAGQKRV